METILKKVSIQALDELSDSLSKVIEEVKEKDEEEDRLGDMVYVSCISLLRDIIEISQDQKNGLLERLKNEQ